MTPLICDSGPLIATFNDRDHHYDRCVRLISTWPGPLFIPEPVLGETCNFLRNNVRNGPALEVRFLSAMAAGGAGFQIIDPIAADRARAAELAEKLVSGPLGYVDGIVIAIAERLGVADIATVDFKFLGMATPVSHLKPLRWALQES